jgi:DNA-directed RNA polymerase subunit RPC12/RpoP
VWIRGEKEIEGNYYTIINYYKCDKCGEEMIEMWPRVEIDDKHYCPDCAFKLNLVTEQEYIKKFCFWCPAKRAAINPETGEIELTDKKFSWERKPKEYRHTKQYQDWRISVFERDNYTCQDCTARGGSLEAHHIKTFLKYPKLRYIKENGITLCRKCHMIRHKRGENYGKT